VIKPLVGKRWDTPSDAAVIRPVLDSDRGLAVTQALNPFYSLIDTYAMAASTIDEAVRRILAVGGDPLHLGGVDNFCWPTIQYDPVQNPDGKYKAAQLVRANWALRDTCLGFGIPLLSGKDSMYVDGYLEGPFGERRKISGLPTLLFTVSSVIGDIHKCVTMDAKVPGDLIYVLGPTRNELGGSEYYQMMGEIGLNVPTVDVDRFRPLYLQLHHAIQEGAVASAHAISRGGLAVHLALIAMAGELGMDLDLRKVPAEGNLTDTQVLYSESAGRFAVTVDPAKKDLFEGIFSGMEIGLLGAVTASTLFRVRGGHGEILMEENVAELKEAWKKPFGGLI
jgi:phosphoribosylformylglycinamidine synthase